jgi:hypothetical protein
MGMDYVNNHQNLIKKKIIKFDLYILINLLFLNSLLSNRLFYIPRIELKSPELHKSVEHIHQYRLLYVRQPSTSKSRTHRSSVQRRSVTLRRKKIIGLFGTFVLFFLAFILFKKRKANHYYKLTRCIGMFSF